MPEKKRSKEKICQELYIYVKSILKTIALINLSIYEILSIEHYFPFQNKETFSEIFKKDIRRLNGVRVMLRRCGTSGKYRP